MKKLLKQKLSDLADSWIKMASLVRNSPSCIPETGAQAGGWIDCAQELRAALGIKKTPEKLKV